MGASLYDSIKIAVQHFVIWQLSISLFIGITFLIYTNTFNFKYLSRIIYWFIRLLTTVIIFIYIYPENEFQFNDFINIFYDFVNNSFIITVILIISFMSLGLIQFNNFKKLIYLVKN